MYYVSCESGLVTATVSGGSDECYSYCASGAVCATCPDDTYYTLEGDVETDNTECTSCEAGKYIVSSDASDHVGADQCSSCGEYPGRWRGRGQTNYDVLP